MEHRTHSPSAPSVDSATLCHAVSKALRQQRQLEGTAISVCVEDGVMTLAGTVHTWRQRIAAIDATHRVRGVLDVADDIVVHPPQRGLTDSQIAADIWACLASDPFVQRATIRSTVSDGWVTLKGTLASDSQRDRMIHDVARSAR